MHKTVGIEIVEKYESRAELNQFRVTGFTVE